MIYTTFILLWEAGCLYKRYIKRNGKRFGPYFYKSVRSGDIVKSVYVSKVAAKSAKLKHPKSSNHKRRK